MNQNKLPPLIEKMFQRIGLIYEAYKLCSSYSTNPYVFDHERIRGRNSKLLYKELLLKEIDLVKVILLEEMNKEVDKPCQE